MVSCRSRPTSAKRPPSRSGHSINKRSFDQPVVETKFVQFPRIVEPVGVDMADRQRHLGPLIALKDGEGGARRFAFQAEAAQKAARERRLPAPRVPLSRTTSPARSMLAQPRTEPFDIGQSLQEHRADHASRGRLIVTMVPCPCSETRVTLPPCASTNWRTSGRPRPLERPSAVRPKREKVSKMRGSQLGLDAGAIVGNNDAHAMLVAVAMDEDPALSLQHN